MTAIGWDWHDIGSGPGHMRRVTSGIEFTPGQAAYCAYVEHCGSCLVCAVDSETCATAQALWEAYKARAETHQ